MSRYFHPDGRKLPALERNILKYRAFQMVLMLFYAEELKDFVIGLIEASDTLADASKRRVPPGTTMNFKKAMAILVRESVLTEKESEEIRKLVDFRNDIAHEVHHLTIDISRDAYTHDYAKYLNKEYDYHAVKRIKFFRRALSRRTMSGFARRMSMDPLLFEPAEKTYERELKLLDTKIRKQREVRRKQLSGLQAELSLDGLPIDLYPYHPLNEKRNGNLSKRGIEVCYRLFDAGKSPLAVGFLMCISRKAANKHHKEWVQAGGVKREKGDLEALSVRPPRRTTTRRFSD